MSSSTTTIIFIVVIGILILISTWLSVRQKLAIHLRVAMNQELCPEQNSETVVEKN